MYRRLLTSLSLYVDHHKTGLNQVQRYVRVFKHYNTCTQLGGLTTLDLMVDQLCLVIRAQKLLHKIHYRNFLNQIIALGWEEKTDVEIRFLICQAMKRLPPKQAFYPLTEEERSEAVKVKNWDICNRAINQTQTYDEAEDSPVFNVIPIDSHMEPRQTLFSQRATGLVNFGQYGKEILGENLHRYSLDPSVESEIPFYLTKEARVHADQIEFAKVLALAAEDRTALGEKDEAKDRHFMEAFKVMEATDAKYKENLKRQVENTIQRAPKPQQSSKVLPRWVHELNNYNSGASSSSAPTVPDAFNQTEIMIRQVLGKNVGMVHPKSGSSHPGFGQPIAELANRVEELEGDPANIRSATAKGQQLMQAIKHAQQTRELAEKRSEVEETESGWKEVRRDRERNSESVSVIEEGQSVEKEEKLVTEEEVGDVEEVEDEAEAQRLSGDTSDITSQRKQLTDGDRETLGLPPPTPKLATRNIIRDFILSGGHPSSLLETSRSISASSATSSTISHFSDQSGPDVIDWSTGYHNAGVAAGALQNFSEPDAAASTNKAPLQKSLLNAPFVPTPAEETTPYNHSYRSREYSASNMQPTTVALPLPVLSTDWTAENNVKVVGKLTQGVERSVEPVGPSFLRHAQRIRHKRTFSEDDRMQALKNVKKVEDDDAGEISEDEDPQMLLRDAKDWKVYFYHNIYNFTSE